MGQTIWPSQNDVGDTEGDGTILTESRVKDILGKLLVHPGILSGFAPSNPSGLTVRCAVGKAFVDGRYCETDATLDATATASATSYVFLRLDIDGSSLATSVSLETRSSPTPPSDRYVIVARVIAGSSTITSLYDERVFAGAGTESGFYTGNGASSRTISTPSGRTPTLVLVSKIDGTADNIVALGAPDPGGRRVAGNSPLVPASRVYFRQGSTHTLPKTLSNSKTWSSGSFALNSYVTTTLTVSGAAVGDPVLAWFETTQTAGRFLLAGYVSAANTVTLTATNVYQSSESFNETVYVRVIDVNGAASVEVDVAHFVNATLTDSQVPAIVSGGFTVSATGSPSLNANGWNFGWVAFY